MSEELFSTEAVENTAPEAVVTEPQTTETPAAAHEELTPEQQGRSEADPAAVVTPEPSAQVAAFVPKTKVTAWGKEHEIPKEFQTLMKDAESEKAVREIFEKSLGVEGYKEKLQARDTEFTQVKSQFDGMSNQVRQAADLYQKATQPGGDIHKMGDFFKKLNVDENAVMAYAIEKAKLAQLPAEQRQMVEARLSAERAREDALMQTTSATQVAQEAQRNAINTEFSMYMENPQVKNFEAELDGKLGKPGFFKQAVVDAGQRAYALEGKTLSVVDAMKAVIQGYGLTGQAASQAQAQMTQALGTDGQAAKKVVQRQAAAIPNVGGSSSASPISKTNSPRSIADLKKLASDAREGKRV